MQTKLPALLLLLLGFNVQAELISNLEGKLSVNQGLLSYSVPLALPAGINKLTPNLSINYIQGGNNSELGLGFSLSGLSTTSRCSKSDKVDDINHGVLLDSNDAYCLDGQRLINVANNEYRLRQNHHTKIIKSSNTWQVHYPNGVSA
ncbi:SpvB/TcaC N-terminal domain-containing protein [Isorropodon fossajaponicum symbiont]|uniref:SpvB/TcaC N-terminal domain-containing protein n=1 Tax=Isorropodon fossajaponicum symbiont TaxID=883811 RepID=UPI001915EFF4|nr:SpvB/TcaC N-terminal domain-containing protein [Isorropodon fossajaponicum symbiont]